MYLLTTEPFFNNIQIVVFGMRSFWELRLESLLSRSGSGMKNAQLSQTCRAPNREHRTIPGGGILLTRGSRRLTPSHHFRHHSI
jgi:hypothetical protein